MTSAIAPFPVMSRLSHGSPLDDNHADSPQDRAAIAGDGPLAGASLQMLPAELIETITSFLRARDVHALGRSAKAFDAQLPNNRLPAALASLQPTCATHAISLLAKADAAPPAVRAAVLDHVLEWYDGHTAVTTDIIRTITNNDDCWDRPQWGGLCAESTAVMVLNQLTAVRRIARETAGLRTAGDLAVTL